MINGGLQRGLWIRGRKNGKWKREKEGRGQLMLAGRQEVKKNDVDTSSFHLIFFCWCKHGDFREGRCWEGCEGRKLRVAPVAFLQK